METVNIFIRDVVPDDIGYIFHTWKESWMTFAVAGLAKKQFLPKGTHKRFDSMREYKAYIHLLIERLLVRGITIKVACMADDLRFILGYVLCEKIDCNQVIYWAYTRSIHRRLGVFTQLLEACSFNTKAPLVVSLQNYSIHRLKDHYSIIVDDSYLPNLNA